MSIQKERRLDEIPVIAGGSGEEPSNYWYLMINGRVIPDTMGDELYGQAKGIIAEKLGIEVEEVEDELIIPGTKEKGVCLGADSLDMVEIVMGIEEKFGVEIPDKQAELVTKVRHMRDWFNVMKADKESPGVLEGWSVMRQQEIDAYLASQGRGRK